MCEDQWRGEEDGTALICDGTATLPVSQVARKLLEYYWYAVLEMKPALMLDEE